MLGALFLFGPLARSLAIFVANRVTISALTCADGEGIMRIFGYLGIVLIVSLLAPASMAVADTAIQAVTPDGTQSPSQPTPEEDLLSLDD